MLPGMLYRATSPFICSGLCFFLANAPAPLMEPFQELPARALFSTTDYLMKL